MVGLCEGDQRALVNADWTLADNSEPRNPAFCSGQREICLFIATPQLYSKDAPQKRMRRNFRKVKVTASITSGKKCKTDTELFSQ